MAFFNESPWQYDTSKEVNVSYFAATGGWGTLYFVNSDDGTKFSVNYSYLAFGVSAGGFPANLAISATDTPSGGITNVLTFPGTKDFGMDTFPCTGWLLTFSQTGGVLSSTPGSDLCAANFDNAGVFFWGQFGGEFPSVGVSVAQATFQPAVPTTLMTGPDTPDDGSGGGGGVAAA